jgi:uncharacterized SAM-binding protein YcdF (DUF218 family)
MSRLKRFCYWFLALSLLALVIGVLFPKPFLLVETKPRPAPILILLGGGPEDRPARTLELMRGGYAPRVLISGDDNEHSSVGKLREAKMTDARILLETNSSSTLENAQFSVKILRAQKITNAIIVTSWHHSRRALACFHHAAPEIQFQSAPTRPIMTPIGLPTARDAGCAFAEYLKMFWYALRYQIFPWQT